MEVLLGAGSAVVGRAICSRRRILAKWRPQALHKLQRTIKTPHAHEALMEEYRAANDRPIDAPSHVRSIEDHTHTHTHTHRYTDARFVSTATLHNALTEKTHATSKPLQKI